MKVIVYILKCNACEAPLGSSLVHCPYCGSKQEMAAILDKSGISKDDRTFSIKGHKQLNIGHTQEGANIPRSCPYCSASVSWQDEQCTYCKNKLLVKTVHIKRNMNIDGELNVGKGGSVEVSKDLSIKGKAKLSGGGNLKVGGDASLQGKMKVNKGSTMHMKKGATLKIRGKLDLRGGGSLIFGKSKKAKEPHGEKLILAVVDDDIEQTRKHIREGANINYESERGTPLYVALNKNKIDIARFLISMGADPSYHREEKSVRTMAKKINDQYILSALQ
ncbi:MAG: hypothetical protein ABUK01_13945 [Leptospirales bacterium]